MANSTASAPLLHSSLAARACKSSPATSKTGFPVKCVVARHCANHFNVSAILRRSSKPLRFTQFATGTSPAHFANLFHTSPITPLSHKKPCTPPSASQSAVSQPLERRKPLPTGENAEGLIFPAGEAGAWDSHAVGGPVVRRYLSDNEERWCMWYHGRASSDEGKAMPLADPSFGSLGLATSSNGIHWSRGGEKVVTDQYGNGGTGMVMEPNQDWWTFDTRHVRVSDVQIMSSQVVRAQSGVYWLYYSGGDAEELPLPELLSMPGGSPPGTIVEGLRQRPGLAMSQDGKNWARIEGEHHSGALFDVGEEGEWDALFVGCPQVVFYVPQDLRMFYHSLDTNSNTFSIGLARSREGVRWQKLGRVLQPGDAPGAFDERGVAAPHVVPDPRGGGYFMAFEMVGGDGRRRIGVAKSKDGLGSWAKAEGVVFAPSDVTSVWDNHSVCRPCLVPMGGDRWRLYYVGYDGGGSAGIGMAESEEGVKGPYRRWRQTDLPSV
ncbi:hypothetical protein KFL_000370190 [Klebsormidium nitens]|uniref:Arabinanase/levansucrase/invertase n=1 Tax=Klebsormidium nitens TaxID=105231 RepID=A0A1Y1HMA9_KLENI|nr:hypothetical protein KFL_000370190 [Klebsormidium nitens]|eukprot:GAQ79745.1 hypothetical protein KFL_000370190 [Klebsormidium nitens]